MAQLSSPARRVSGGLLRRVAATAVVICLFLLAVSFALREPLKNALRKEASEALEARFESRLQYRSFDIQFFPPGAVLQNVVFRQQKNPDLPPLIQIAQIRAEAGLGLLWFHPHVRHVQLDGLDIRIPTKRDREGGGHETPRKKPARFPFTISELTADSASVIMLRGPNEKPPLQFDIHHLRMQNVNLDEPADFEATLTNPRPTGEIQTSGQFGPWQADEPSLTPVRGRYDFSHANLADFKGIGGILSSQGKYDGVLQRIEVNGKTDTPDFYLSLAKHPVPLVTTFHAIVDGTNGNTALQQVSAKLGSSAFTARGEVSKFQDESGRRVLLETAMEQGRLEDVLRLSVRAAVPPLTGALRFQGKIDIPAGKEGVVEKLRLDGQFEVEAARFASLNIREKLRSLSRKGQGAPEDPSAGSSISNLRGRFTMEQARIHFSSLTFELEGASVNLAGTYGLTDEALDLHGQLYLDAKLSQTTTGAKAVLLKALDPFFRGRKGGSQIPIKITGTRSNPSFGLDLTGKKS